MSTEQTADAPLTLAVVALVCLPLAGCASTPAQADPALEVSTVTVQPAQEAVEVNTITARPAQEVVPNVAPAPNTGDATVRPAHETVPTVVPAPNTGDANGVPVLAALDVEDGAVVVLAGDNGTVVPAPRTVPDVGVHAAQHALEVVGTPYIWGGNTPGGFDCSGLVQYSYSLAGVELPRVTIKQRSATRAVSRKQLRPGDLLFFHIDGKRYSHIGIYIGDGQFVHAPRTGKFVSTANLSNPYWQRFFGGARRPVPDGRLVSDYRPVDRLSALDRVRMEN